MPPGRVDRGPEDPGSSPALGQHVPGTKVIGVEGPDHQAVQRGGDTGDVVGQRQPALGGRLFRGTGQLADSPTLPYASSMSDAPIVPVGAEPPLSEVPASAVPPRVVVIGCGALARELLVLTKGLPGVKVHCVDARLHMRPSLIADAVEKRIVKTRDEFGPDVRIFVAYADCGTGGALDKVLEHEGVERIAGAHCYEFYAGSATYAAMQDEELGTFYLTDFLARQFETIVLVGLGLDRHPELMSDYFGSYRRLVYLAQTDDPELTAKAEAAAATLGLAFERRMTGYGDLAPTIQNAIRGGA